MSSAENFNNQINWPQLISTVLLVLIPLMGYAFSLESRLSVIEERIGSHVTANEGHPGTVARVNSLERDVAQTQQFNLEILRRLEAIDAKLQKISSTR